jgi:multidrug resistance efflux pump
MDSPLPPIPTPASQRWREFRIRVLPVVVFVCIVLGASVLWLNFVAPVAIIGQVEAIQAHVSSIAPGTLAEVRVERFQRVKRDELLGYVVTTDTALTEAALNQISADLKLMEARMGLDKIRNLDAYTSKRLDLLKEQIALATARVKLPLAEQELERVTKLRDSNIIPLTTLVTSQVSYESALRERDSLQVEVKTRAKLVDQYEQEIAAMSAAGGSYSPTKDPAIEEAIKAQQEKLRLADKPATLKAPIDGMVSMVFKRSGEKIIAGEPLITITPLETDRIIAWIRQPLDRIPTTNDMARVRTRTTRRHYADAQIVEVGRQLETIDPLLLSPDGKVQDRGLPILIRMPPGLPLTPGEYVDISIEKK